MLTVLRQAAIFMVASKMILHFFPGSKYDRYGKMMVSLIVLSQLAAPLFSFFNGGMMDDFWEKADRLEAENEMFSQKLQDFGEGQESLVENGVVLSVEEKIEEQAQNAGVSVRDVYIDGGVVVIEVTADDSGEGQNPVSPVKVEKIEPGNAPSEAYDGVAGAGAGAVKGRLRPDLAEIFATELEVEEGKVEVIEHR